MRATQKTLKKRIPKNPGVIVESKMNMAAVEKRALEKEMRKKVEKATDLKMKSQRNNLTNNSSRC